jgi:hypothetical protein
MALAERLRDANTNYQKNFICKLIRVTLDPKISKEDIDALLNIINLSPHDEGHVPNTRLAHALREEGYDISASAIDRHRRGSCSCSRLK